MDKWIRVIGKFFFLLAIIGFFSPIACDMNAPQLIDAGFMASEGIFAVISILVLSFIGLLLGGLILALKGNKPVLIADWVVTILAFIFTLVTLIVDGFVNGNREFWQVGAYLMIIGGMIPLLFQIVSVFCKKK